MADGQFETLEDVDKWCVGQLVRAAVDKRSPFRWPILCTAGPGPKGRVVVLRNFEQATRSLIFFTDKRSHKCEELRVHDGAECVFFDPKKMIQIRARGPVKTAITGPQVDQHFENVATHSWRDYAYSDAPGTPIDQWPSYSLEEAQALQNFCVLTMSVETLDWLNLSREGHQRALLNWSDSGPGHSWLVP
ncbi:MAG: hypothetical protein AAFV54_02320 [Pseudomonadota bacterium]